MRGPAVALVLAAACSRSAGTKAELEAGAPSVAPSVDVSPLGSALPTPEPTSSEPPREAPPSRPPLPPAPSGEAVRTTLAALDRDPRLRSQLAKLREHFDAGAAGPFAEQRVGLQGGRTAVLVSRPDESDPIVLVLDREDMLFAKTRPTAGIAPPVLHATIAPGPEGGVVVFAYVASMHIVAARMWADDSNPYADIEVFRPDACDALAAAYEPGAGWIVACSSDAGTRAQRLRENLTGAWAHEGVPVGPRSAVVGRPAIAFDGASTWTLSERAKAVGGDRQVTTRYGLDGELR